MIVLIDLLTNDFRSFAGLLAICLGFERYEHPNHPPVP
jgi:hypothetical protein